MVFYKVIYAVNQGGFIFKAFKKMFCSPGAQFSMAIEAPAPERCGDGFPRIMEKEPQRKV
jgi:hypothetical protein